MAITKTFAAPVITTQSSINWELVGQSTEERLPPRHKGYGVKYLYKTNYYYGYHPETDTHHVKAMSIASSWDFISTPTWLQLSGFDFGKLTYRLKMSFDNGKFKLLVIRPGDERLPITQSPKLAVYKDVPDTCLVDGAIKHRLYQWLQQVAPWAETPSLYSDLDVPGYLAWGAGSLTTQKLINGIKFPYYLGKTLRPNKRGSYHQFKKPLKWLAKQLFGASGKACTKAIVEATVLDAKWIPLFKGLRKSGWTTDHLLALFKLGNLHNTTHKLCTKFKPSKALRLLESAQCEWHIDDVAMQLSTIENNYEQPLNLSKARNLTRLHDAVSKVYRTISGNNPEYKLWHYPELEAAKDKLLLGNYQLVIPQTNHELSNWGSHFSNCVASYTSLIHNGENIVFALKNISTNELEWCCEMGTNRKLKQFSAKYNKSAADNLWQQLQQELMVTLPTIKPQCERRSTKPMGQQEYTFAEVQAMLDSLL